MEYTSCLIFFYCCILLLCKVLLYKYTQYPCDQHLGCFHIFLYYKQSNSKTICIPGWIFLYNEFLETKLLYQMMQIFAIIRYYQFLLKKQNYIYIHNYQNLKIIVFLWPDNTSHSQSLKSSYVLMGENNI